MSVVPNKGKTEEVVKRSTDYGDKKVEVTDRGELGRGVTNNKWVR